MKETAYPISSPGACGSGDLIKTLKESEKQNHEHDINNLNDIKWELFHVKIIKHNMIFHVKIIKHNMNYYHRAINPEL